MHFNISQLLIFKFESADSRKGTSNQLPKKNVLFNIEIFNNLVKYFTQPTY